MIKKLRNRLLLITMLLLSIVLVITFTALIISSANRMETESFRSLNDNYMRIELNDKKLPYDIEENDVPMIKREKPFDGFSPFSAFFVTLDEENEIVIIDDFSRQLDESIFTDAVEQALEQSADEGTIKSLNIRYKVYNFDDMTRVIGFIDISYERSFIRQQIINYSVIGLISLGAFFLVSLLLSKIAIKPIQSAWQKQQQFVADASHELKTPITVMLANTSILLSSSIEDEKEKKKWITYIEQEAKRMKKLVEDMLFLARVDASENLEEHTRIQLSNAVSESVLPFEAVMFESGRELESDIEEDIYVKADVGQIKQLVCILLDNANKYADEKSKIKIRLFKDGAKAVIEVNNMGELIDDDKADVIFNRFVRGDKARTRHKNSYGLGLSIAREIVLSHKGKISVRSNAQEGTTFTVSLTAI